MTPSHCIFKLIDNRLSCGVVELPAQPGFFIDTSLVDDKEREAKYQKAYNEALANAIWFREEKDVQLMEEMILTDHEGHVFKIEEMKPYKLPEGLEIEIKMANTEKDISIGLSFRNFAFLKQPKEQEKPNQYRITKIQQEKEESQNELWVTIHRMILDGCPSGDLKSKFTIQRK